MGVKSCGEEGEEEGRRGGGEEGGRRREGTRKGGEEIKDVAPTRATPTLIPTT